MGFDFQVMLINILMVAIPLISSLVGILLCKKIPGKRLDRFCLGFLWGLGMVFLPHLDFPLHFLFGENTMNEPQD